MSVEMKNVYLSYKKLIGTFSPRFFVISGELV